MKRILCLILFCLLVLESIYSNGGSEAAAASEGRGRYLAGEGLIIPPEEVIVDSYIAQVDYQYPAPINEVGLSLFTANRQISNQGQDSILQIGIQGQTRDWEDLPPLNLAFVIDISASMAEENKLEWVKSAFDLFIDRIRPTDYISLVVFNDSPTVVFSSRSITDNATKEEFRSFVRGLSAQGGSDLEVGLKAGYEQVMRNYRTDYTNRVLFLSDGTELSSRLSRAGGQTGRIRATLVWNNRNDLDLHMITPTGEEIYYANNRSATGGMLDVDMNAGGQLSVKPVENIFWPDYSRPPEGTYEVFVRNFAYNEKKREPNEFYVELKYGSETSRFEGITSVRTGPRSDITAFRFNYSSDSVRKADIYQIAEQYRQMGVNVTTIGVGTGFDLDFMNTLAKESGGSSRFIADRQAMEELFGIDFDRMIVSAARDLNVDLRFLLDVDILETWGYQHELTEDGIRFSLPTLHARDYETILVRFATGKNPTIGDVDLAEVSITYRDNEGVLKDVEAEPIRIRVVDSLEPVSGYSNGIVLRSGTIMDFARRLIDIGELYYEVQDSLEYGFESLPNEARNSLNEALRLTRLGRAELENAAIRLDDEAIFEDEMFILSNYEKTLISDLDEKQESNDIDTTNTAAGIDMASAAEYLPSLPSEISIDTHVKYLVDEILLGFPTRGTPVVAIAGVSPGPISSATLVELINNELVTKFTSQTELQIVERDQLDRIIEEQQLSLSGLIDTTTAVRIGNIAAAEYIVTGSVIETSNSIIVFVRILNTETGVVESAAQTIIERTDS